MNHREIFQKKMTSAGMSPEVISLFISYYNKLSEGKRGFILEKDLQPVLPKSLPKLDELQSYKSQGLNAIGSCAIIKLNGGLGTSMGLSGPKSFLPVKENKRFIDIVADQVRYLRKTYNCSMPLIMMNSTVTEEDTETFFQENSDLIIPNIAHSFIHHNHPKVLVEDNSPAENPKAPESEWNPAGHGDIYAALVTTGILDELLSQGITHAFISNVDNLGATFEPSILGYMLAEATPFIMEVAPRREMDKKGGHIARDLQGNLLLRERAQADSSELEQFEDITTYAYFNTNSLWLNLEALHKRVVEHGLLELPLIANQKNLIATDTSTPMVYQIETAMGSAINLFQNAQAIEIPQSRFRPVKKNDDLLLLWSDRFKLTEASELEQVSDATKEIYIELDPNIYAHYSDLAQRITAEPPSLKKCTNLTVSGDFTFDSGCVFIGDVVLRNYEKQSKHLSTVISKSNSLL